MPIIYKKLRVKGHAGESIDVEAGIMHIVGKGGRKRTLRVPPDLLEKMNLSLQYPFAPKPSWKSAFYQVVRNMARKLEITVSGIHRFRANFAQSTHKNLMENQGLPDRPARKEVSQVLGHNRVDVVASYIPIG